MVQAFKEWAFCYAAAAALLAALSASAVAEEFKYDEAHVQRHAYCRSIGISFAKCIDGAISMGIHAARVRERHQLEMFAVKGCAPSIGLWLPCIVDGTTQEKSAKVVNYIASRVDEAIKEGQPPARSEITQLPARPEDIPLPRPRPREPQEAGALGRGAN